MSNPISNSDDVIDSREVIERIEELKAAWSEATGDDYADYSLSGDDLKAGLPDDEAVELVALRALAEEGEGVEDWQYGATLIRDSHFQDYARELAEDIGAVPSEYTWPTSCIDWEQAARELRTDYTSVDFDGVTYWVR